ncbi:MAG TPA: RNA 2',3'-cyclic phosphodiesterase [Candidatus Polarisedimenticolia bacterium]|nr:RNA 2',3'-cyclic phosphodiesterase [Candidatus Polarisedimenticolia bacterium]
MRIFIAVEVPGPVREGIVGVQEKLASVGIREVRWVDAPGIHLTLRFCGELSRERVDRLANDLSAGLDLPVFRVSIGGLGVFPPRGNPRVIWVGVRSEGPLASLAAWVEAKATGAGIPPEPRPFHPHLTLGRFRAKPGKRIESLLARIPSPELGEVVVDRFVLFESRLETRGARHIALRAFPLVSRRVSGSES